MNFFQTGCVSMLLARPRGIVVHSIILALLIMTLAASAHTETRSYVRSDSAPLNPDRGWYLFRPLTAGSDFASVRPMGVSLVYSELNLGAFRHSEISKERLQEIDDAFTRVRLAGIKSIVRIVYSSQIGDEDISIPFLKKHLAQLAPLFKKHNPVIYLFQAGCIGAWGEWHASSNKLDTPEGRKQVIDLLLKYLPPAKQIALRTPAFKIEFLAGRVGAMAERLSHHNDCFLATDTDSGTYAPDAIESLKQKIRSDGEFLIIGGETCRPNPPRSECASALKELHQLHFSYLNRDYQPEVIEQFRAGGCYDEIGQRLGYRLHVDSLFISFDHAQNVIKGAILFSNSGFAPLYAGRPLIVHAFDVEGNQIFTKPIGVLDSLSNAADETKRIEFSLTVKGDFWKNDHVILRLELPDSDPSLKSDPRYSIRLASEMSWDGTMGLQELGSFAISKK